MPNIQFKNPSKSTKAKLLYLFILCLYMEIDTKIRKWGNSYGVLIPKSVLEEEHLTENDSIKINIIGKKKDLEKLFGLCKFKKPTNEIIKEIKEAYDD